MIRWRRKWQPTPALAWEIPWTEEPGWPSPQGCKRVRQDLATKQQQSEVAYPNYTCYDYIP